MSGFARALNGVYYTKTREEMEDGLAKAPKTIERLEEALTRQRDLNNGPYFNGPNLSLVDCAYAPFLQRFLIATVFTDGPARQLSKSQKMGRRLAL